MNAQLRKAALGFALATCLITPPSSLADVPPDQGAAGCQVSDTGYPYPDTGIAAGVTAYGAAPNVTVWVCVERLATATAPYDQSDPTDYDPEKVAAERAAISTYLEYRAVGTSSWQRTKERAWSEGVSLMTSLTPSTDYEYRAVVRSSLHPERGYHVDSLPVAFRTLDLQLNNDVIRLHQSPTDSACQDPTIVRISPSPARAGDLVFIDGTGFGTTGRVALNGSPASIESWSPTRIVVFAPAIVRTISGNLTLNADVSVSCGAPGEGITSRVRGQLLVTSSHNAAPVANASGRYKSGKARFDGSLSIDPDATAGGGLKYRWTVGKRVISTKKTASRALARGKQVTATLTVTDKYGATASTKVRVKAIAATKLETIRLLAPADITFDFGSCAISGAGVKYLAKVRKQVRGATSLSLAGHTDWVGGDAYNRDLSKCRAQAVQRELLAGLKGKSKPGKVTATWYGESKPIATNLTDIGRTKNRRVEIVIKRVA